MKTKKTNRNNVMDHACLKKYLSTNSELLKA